MTTIKPGADGYFLINGIPYQKGTLEVKINGSKISFVRVSEGIISDDNIIYLEDLENLRDGEGNGFQSLSSLLAYLETFFFNTPNEGGRLDELNKTTKSNETTLQNILEAIEQTNFLLKNIAEK